MISRGLLLAVMIAFSAVPASASEKIGGPAPSFEVKTMDGRKVDLASLRGKVVILTFWATWCAPCREEMATFETYYEAHHKDGLEIIAINQDDPVNAAKVRQAMSSITFPAASDAHSDYSRYGRISELPVSVVIDRDGVVRADSRQGTWVFDAARLETIVTPLLRK